MTVAVADLLVHAAEDGEVIAVLFQTANVGGMVRTVSVHPLTFAMAVILAQTTALDAVQSETVDVVRPPAIRGAEAGDGH
jgi:hypothetical protein